MSLHPTMTYSMWLSPTVIHVLYLNTKRICGIRLTLWYVFICLNLTKVHFYVFKAKHHGYYVFWIQQRYTLNIWTQGCLLYDYVFISSIVCLFVCLYVLNATFKLQYFRYIAAISFIGGGPEENHRPTACHCQTLSHNVVHLALIEIRAHTISGGRPWLYR